MIAGLFSASAFAIGVELTVNLYGYCANGTMGVR